MEAAQAGCALVLSDIATLRELWDDAALFVEPGDPAGYAAAFQRLFDDPAERRRLGARAKARSVRYSADRMSTAMLEIYRRLQPRLAKAPAQEVAA